MHVKTLSSYQKHIVSIKQLVDELLPCWPDIVPDEGPENKESAHVYLHSSHEVKYNENSLRNCIGTETSTIHMIESRASWILVCS
jgi:hypothetical protein